MTDKTNIQEIEEDVTKLRNRYGHLEDYEAYAIASEQYTVAEYMELKRRLQLSPQELIETILFITKRGGIEGDTVYREDREPGKEVGANLVSTDEENRSLEDE